MNLKEIIAMAAKNTCRPQVGAAQHWHASSAKAQWRLQWQALCENEESEG